MAQPSWQEMQAMENEMKAAYAAREALASRPSETKRMPEVWEQVEALAKAAAYVEDMVSSLHEKIAPVTSPRPPEAVERPLVGQQQPSAPLAGSLAEIANKLTALGSRIRQIRESVEL